MDLYALNIEPSGQQPQQIIGKEKVLVPNHLIKYMLREGGGPEVKPGMTIHCIVNVFLIDGTPLIKGTKITKYLYGRNRLIEGLEVGLRGVKKNQKLRLVISPEYAYEEQNEITILQPKSKLIFEIEVISIVKVPPEQMSDIELYYETYYYLDIAERYLRRKDERKGISYLGVAFSYAKKIRQYKCTIQGKILLKWSNILFYRKEYDDALLVLLQIDRNSYSLIEDTIRLHIKILKELGRWEELEVLVHNTYTENMENKQMRRMCVDYYKEMENWDKLKNLSGYNFKKDKFVDPPKKEEKTTYYSFLL